MDTTDHLPRLQKRLLLFLSLTIATYLLMRWVSGGMSGAEIVEFEMAKTAARAQDILRSWDHDTREQFLYGVHVDFIFIIAYGGLFFNAARLAGKLSGNYILAKAGNFFSWLAIGAGLFDAVENTAMIYTLLREVSEWSVHLSYDMAAIKFSLLFILLLYISIGLFVWVLDRVMRRRQ